MLIIRILFFNLLLLSSLGSISQINSTDTNSIPSEALALDSSFSTTDSLNIDSNTTTAKKPFLESEIKYVATDSMRFDLKNQKVYMYGDAEVYYDNITLNSGFIEMNFEKKELYASGFPDTSGKEIGKPEFDDNGESFSSNELRYNFETKKGIILDANTQQNDGHITGERVKKDENDVLYIKNGEYCPCEDPNAGTYLKSSKLKIIKDDKIISGPAYLVIEDIPTPLAIPFGIFPNHKERASGIILPQYGNSPTLGFYLLNGGYFWAVNDHLNLSFTGDIYSRGSWGLSTLADYRRKYHYNGNLEASYSLIRNGDPLIADEFSEIPNFFLKWKHSQDQKARPNSSFSANVNFGSQNNFRRNFNSGSKDYLTTNFSSSINYNYNIPNSPVRFNIAARHNQNNQDTTKTYDIILPQASMNITRFFPLKRKEVVGKERFYEKIGMSYSGTFVNKLKTTESQLKQGLFYDPENLNSTQGFNLATMNNGIRHSIPISTNMKVLKHLSFKPSINTTQTWYFKSLSKDWDPIKKEVNTDTIGGFKQFTQMNFSGALGTTVYGMYTFSGSRLKAIRHQINPNLTLNYRPDWFDYKQEYQSDSAGTISTYTEFDGGVYGAPNNNRSGTINFSLDNRVEMKYLAKDDTTGIAKKSNLLDQLNINSNYEIYRDSLNFAPIKVSAATNILRLFNLRFNSTLNPYALNTSNTGIIDVAEFSKSGKLARVTQTGINLGMNFDNREKVREAEKKEETFQPIPWSLRLDYNYNIQRPLARTTITQTIRLDYKVRITEGWQMGGQTHFDIRAQKMSYTSLNFERDLNCWELKFRIIPFGNQKSYTFTLNVKPAILKDLKIERKRNWYDINDL